MDEFALIRSFFAPLSQGSTLGLSDDAALWTPPKGKKIVVSTDGYVEGVHFRKDDRPEAVGEKILRAALSDLAAMGAEPQAWFLTAAFGQRMAQRQIKQFAAGCKKAQQRYGLVLLGGDMIAKKGRSVFSVTVLGSAQNIMRRSGAKQGDRLYITGTLGDAALGLRFPKNRVLAKRYLYPEPRVAFSLHLPQFVSAAIDVSDGLMADLTHLCQASKTGAIIRTHDLPLSAAAKKIGGKQLVRLALNAGDDYELLIAASQHYESKLFALAKRTSTPLAYIGDIKGSAIIALDQHNHKVKPLSSGFKHF